MAEQVWRAAEILRLGVGAGQQLVYARATRTVRVLERQKAALLASCQTFRTIDDHARTPEARVELEVFARDGLLVEEDALRARCRAAAQKEDPVTISTVSVVTADRVGSLRQCLSSYLDNARSHERTISVQVMDDARTAKSRTQTQQMLSALARVRGAEIIYAGADEKRALARALAADGEIPPEVLEFALFDPEGCGRTTGANHNAQLLFAAGQPFVSVDDDTTARLAPTPGGNEGLALSSEYESQPTWFFADRARAVAGAVFADEDALSVHEHVLGRTPSSCVGDVSPASLAVDRLGAMLLRQVESGRGRVSVTQTGLVGDAASAYPPALSHLRGDSWARLVASEEGYRQAARSREVRRGSAQLTITDNAALSTGPVSGFDARALLPPFFPVQRNTDGIFGVTLRSTIQGSCIAHLPWTFEHAPEEARLIEEDAVTRFAGRSRLQDIVLACLHSFAFVAGSDDEPSARIAALGQHLRGIGSLENEDFLTFMRPWVWRVKAGFIAALEQDLAAHNSQPSYWAADVQRFVETLRQALATDAYFVPEDLPNLLADEERIQLTRRLIGSFGDLMTWWPVIFERARAIRAGGPPYLLRL
jgi:hypothetical protein